MRVRVRLFAFMAQAARTRDMELELPAGATVLDVERTLKLQLPHLPWPEKVMWAVNQEYVSARAGSDEVEEAGDPGLKEGDEVAIIPPVSGG